MNILLTVSVFIFPLITFPYVSRILRVEGLGKVQFATALISYFTLFSQLGIPVYGIRVCAKVRDDRRELSKTVHELFIVQFFTTIAVYIAFFVLLLSVPRFQADRTLYVIVSLNIFGTFIGMEWLYKALEQYTYITIRSIIFKIIALGAMFVLIKNEADYVIYGGITIFAASASNIFNFIHVRKHIDVKPIGNYSIFKHIRPMLVFFAMSCATTVYTHLATVMLGFMSTDANVGYYGAATKIKTIMVAIVTSLGTVLLPRASYYVKNNKMVQFRYITARALQFVILLATPMAVYFMIFAPQGIRFLSGGGYDGAIVPMIIVMPTLLLIGMTNIMGIQILVPTGREKIVLYSVISGAAGNIITNAVLIPRIESIGAAIGTLVAEIIVFSVQFYVLKKEVKDTFRKIPYIKVGMALILAVCASVWIYKLKFGNFLTLVTSATCFFGMYGGVLLITKETLITEILQQLLRKIKRNKN